jgi:hypothetical protein
VGEDSDLVHRPRLPASEAFAHGSEARVVAAMEAEHAPALKAIQRLDAGLCRSMIGAEWLFAEDSLSGRGGPLHQVRMRVRGTRDHHPVDGRFGEDPLGICNDGAGHRGDGGGICLDRIDQVGEGEIWMSSHVFGVKPTNAPRPEYRDPHHRRSPFLFGALGVCVVTRRRPRTHCDS